MPLRPEVLVLCSAVVAGCGVSEGGTPGTLAARVNAEPITVQELEAARKRDNTPRGDTPRGDILERLIDQRLARQHAIDRGLDRTPQILQALEAAKTDILAHAYRQLVAEALPRPTPEEIRRYYAEHPELFAQRRIYSLDEVVLARGRELAAALRERAAQGEPLEAIARWLESLDARFTASRATRAAEQLPLEVLLRLQAMKEGEIHADDLADGGVVLLRLAAARLAPLDEAAAAPLIEKFLLARRSSEALAAELKRLRKEARVEYLTGTQ